MAKSPRTTVVLGRKSVSRTSLRWMRAFTASSTESGAEPSPTKRTHATERSGRVSDSSCSCASAASAT